MEKRGLGILWFFLNFIIGLYFLNSGLKLINFSFITDSINNVIMIVGGALLIIGGFISMRRSSSMQTIR